MINTKTLVQVITKTYHLTQNKKEKDTINNLFTGLNKIYIHTSNSIPSQQMIGQLLENDTDIISDFLLRLRNKLYLDHGVTDIKELLYPLYDLKNDKLYDDVASDYHNTDIESPTMYTILVILMNMNEISKELK